MNREDIAAACRNFVNLGWATSAGVVGDKFDIRLTPVGQIRVKEFAKAVLQLRPLSPQEREAVTWLAVVFSNDGKIPPPDAPNR
jgi:hypothetical protein